MRRVWIAGLFAFLLLTTPFLARGVRAAGWEIDATGTVDHVVDGDTLDVATVGRVRLADINAPEVGQPGAQEATDYLASLVFNETVYLDIDDVYGTDIYGRAVAVVYVRHDATSLLNVNKALLDGGLAAPDDFPNEFDPARWSLYVYYPIPSGFDANGVLLWTGVAVAAGAVAFAVLCVVLRRRGR